MKKVSIVIVSYNEKEYIGDAIESCLAQKGIEDCEIIIGDDGSSDGSIEVIKQYQSMYPNIIKSFVMERKSDDIIIAPIRVSKIIKRATSISLGEYLIISSADDLIIGDRRLERQIYFLDQHMDYSASYTNFKLFWPDGTSRVYDTKGIYSRSMLWGIHYIHISCFMFRRNVVHNFLEDFCDDTGAMFSILKTGKIHHLNVLGFAYRQRDKSIMHSSDEMELHIMELLLYQDVINAKGYAISSLSRFSRPMRYIMKNRVKLNEEKYRKYRCIGNNKKNDLITIIANSNKSIMVRMYLYSIIFLSRILRKIYYETSEMLDKIHN